MNAFAESVRRSTLVGSPAWGRLVSSAALGLALILNGCTGAGTGAVSDAPSPSLPADPSPSSESTATTQGTPSSEPAPTEAPTPVPPVLTAAEVSVTAGDLVIEYAIDRCPVTAWNGAALSPGVTFGIYPNGAAASDGRQWATQMVVMRFANGTPADWSFILSTPPGVPSAQNERRLLSSPGVMGMEMSAEIAPAQATFTTSFLEAATSSLLPATVTVTCH
jgi:hypothetical protein